MVLGVVIDVEGMDEGAIAEGKLIGVGGVGVVPDIGFFVGVGDVEEVFFLVRMGIEG